MNDIANVMHEKYEKHGMPGGCDVRVCGMHAFSLRECRAMVMILYAAMATLFFVFLLFTDTKADPLESWQIKEGALQNGDYYRIYDMSAGSNGPLHRTFDMNFKNIDKFFYYDYYNSILNCSCGIPTSAEKQYQELKISDKETYVFDRMDYGEGKLHYTDFIDVGSKNWGVEPSTFDSYVPRNHCSKCDEFLYRWSAIGVLYLLDCRGSAEMAPSYDVQAGGSVSVFPHYNEYVVDVKWGIKYSKDEAFKPLSDGVLPNGTVVSGSQTRQLVLSNLPAGIEPMYVGAYLYDKDGQLPENAKFPATNYVSKISVYTAATQDDPSSGSSTTEVITGSVTDPAVTQPTTPGTTIGSSTDPASGDSGGGGGESGSSGGGAGTGGSGSGGSSSSSSGGNTSGTGGSGSSGSGGSGSSGSGLSGGSSGSGGNSGGNSGSGGSTGSGTSGGNSGGSSGTAPGNSSPGSSGSGSGGSTGGSSGSAPSTDNKKTLEDYKNTAQKEEYVTGTVIKGTPDKSAANAASGKSSTGKGSGSSTSGTSGKATATSSDGKGTGGQGINGTKTGNPKLISESERNRLFEQIRSNSHEYITNSETSHRNLKENASGNDGSTLKLSSLENDDGTESYTDGERAEYDEFSPDVRKKSAVFYIVVIFLVVLLLVILLFVLFFGVIIVAPKENELLKFNEDFNIKVPVGLSIVLPAGKEWAVSFGELLSKYDVLDVYLGILFAYVFEGEDIKIMTRFKGEKKKEIATEKISRQLTIGSKRGIK